MSLEPDKLAQSDHDIWLECAARQKLAADSEAEYRTKGVEALKFRWGDQWPDIARNDRKLDGRPCLTVNHTNVVCTRLENQLRQQRPRIKVHPVSNATVDKANKVAGLIRHIETISNASVAYDKGVEKAKDIGLGYWRIVSEYCHPRSFDQELKILPIRNPFTVYMDPAAIMPAGEDQQWCVISESMPRPEYKRRYPNAENCDYQFTEAPGDYTLDWESQTQVRLAEYFRIFEKADKLVQMEDGRIVLASELPEDWILQAMDLRIARDGNGQPHWRPSTFREVQWFRLNGKKIVDRRTLKGQYVPVIRVEGNVLDLNGKTLRKGAIQDLMDPAQMYNYWRTAQTERLALTPKAPWVMAEGQAEGHPEWDDANRKSYSKLVYKPVTDTNGNTLPPPIRQNPAQVEAGFAEAVAGAEHDLMTVAGMPQENPEIAARVVSGNKYLQRRQGMQDMTHFQYYDNQTYSIMWTGVVLLDLIPHYYDTQRMQRIIGEDGVPQVIELKKKLPDGTIENDFSDDARYDIVMDTGPGYATKREEAAENMLSLLGTPLGEVVTQTGSDVVLRNMDFPGADVLADRAAVKIPEAMEQMVEGLPEQAKNIIGSMQQQLTALQQQNQEMALELKYKAGVEQMKDAGATSREQIKAQTAVQTTGMKVGSDDANSQRDFAGWIMDTKVNSETALKVQDSKADTARDVAEINQAGKLLDTHAEAAHEAAAADKMIKAGQTDRKP